MTQYVWIPSYSGPQCHSYLDEDGGVGAEGVDETIEDLDGEVVDAVADEEHGEVGSRGRRFLARKSLKSFVGTGGREGKG